MPALPPVLLVHGFGSSFQHGWVEPGWLDILADEGREVLGGDLPGHGTADKPTDPAAYAAMEDGVGGWLQDHDQVDAVGFSLGARLLLTVASRHPSRFRRLVVMGVGSNLFRNEGGDQMARAVETGESSDPVSRLFAQLAADPRNDPAALSAVLRRPSPRLTATELGAVSMPVLIVIGERDFAGPADPLADALPDASVTVLPGVDHFATPRDYRCIDAVVRFLSA